MAVARCHQSDDATLLTRQLNFGFTALPVIWQVEVSFFANVSSRSLYVVVRRSVVCLSVTFVRPTQAIEIFGSVLRHLVR